MGNAVGGFMALAAVYMIASTVLQALTLSRGLNGQFVPSGMVIGEPGAASTGVGGGTPPAFQTTPGAERPSGPQYPAPEYPAPEYIDVVISNPEDTISNPTNAADTISNPAAEIAATPIGGPPPRTMGDCEVTEDFQGENYFLAPGCDSITGTDQVDLNQRRWNAGCFPKGVPPWHPENNILVQYPDPSVCPVAVSSTWMVSGWNHTLVQLAPNEAFVPPAPARNEMVAVKLLRGTLLDVNTNGVLRSDGRWETYVVTPPNRAVSLWLSSGVTRILAGDDGAAFVYFKVTRDVFNTPVTDMSVSPVTLSSGPFSENLQWTQFGRYYDDFAGVEFYNYAGLLLNNHDGSRLTYLQWWTFREDEDADGYHDHSGLGPDNTFAELHMALFPSSGTSGMQTTLPNTNNFGTVANPVVIHPEDQHKYNDNDQNEVQLSIPLPPGYVHGPLWSVNSNTGEPSVGCNGGVLYPNHRWLGGAGNGPNGYHTPPRYSLWVAFEHPPQYATIPRTMLASWTNAYLQSEMDTPDCSA